MRLVLGTTHTRPVSKRAGPERFFTNFDLGSFWDDSDYARSTYVAERLTSELIASVEAELGYTLPGSYVALAETQNGGVPINRCAPAPPTTWAEDHVALTGIFGIGRMVPGSVCGEWGSRLWLEEWGYPDIGVYLADCPSAGHDMIALDYRECGPTGEPCVVHVDQEVGYVITPIAEDFESFIRGLLPCDAFDDE